MASTKKKRTTPKSAKAAITEAKAAPKVSAQKQEQPVAKSTTKTLILKKITTADLFRWNKWLAWIYALQGIVLVVLSATRSFPVTTSFLSPNPLVADHLSLVNATHHLFDINLTWLIAAIFFVAALIHVAMATKCRTRYEQEVDQGINRMRWAEFAVGGGLTLVVIALLGGVYDISTLGLLFVMNVIAGSLGWGMEFYNQGKKEQNWLAHGVSLVAGITPWVVLGLYLFGANVYGTGHVAPFIYWVYGSMAVCFAGQFVTTYLQQSKKGKWVDYLYGERMFMILWVITYTALAWQIFVGTLQP